MYLGEGEDSHPVLAARRRMVPYASEPHGCKGKNDWRRLWTSVHL